MEAEVGVLNNVVGFDLNKPKDQFRVYDDPSNPMQAIIVNHYRMMRSKQTLEFVRRMHAKYSFAGGASRATMSIREAFGKLDGYVDSSDPDLSLPNIVHSFQTAEGMRKAGKPDWMQLVGLIHDMGKIMFLWGTGEDGQEGTATGQQFALGGDTFVVGCAIPDTTVFPEFNSLNPDASDARYNTPLGIYKEHCGLDNVMFAYGHDEYLYQMLKANGCTIPEEGFYMVRYHSAYPWHTGKSYRHLMNATDESMEAHVIDFNKFDLYTKDETAQGQLSREEIEETLWPYYEGLIERYFPRPTQLRW